MLSRILHSISTGVVTRTNNIFDRDANSNDSFGLSGINREFDLIKADGAIASIDDPSNINPLSVNVVGTKKTLLSFTHCKVALTVTPLIVLTSSQVTI